LLAVSSTDGVTSPEGGTSEHVGKQNDLSICK
jgi:hypothetical protein